MLEKIASLYKAYAAEFHQLEQKRRPLEGAFGFGRGPQNYPCHEKFAQDLERALQDFVSQRPDSKQVEQVLHYIYFTAPASLKSAPAVDQMLLAVHGLTLELIELLDASDAGSLYNAYQADYSRRHRFPVQDRLLIALQDRCGEVH